MIPGLPLNNGLVIPSLGLGTWKIKKENVTQTVSTAIQLGYRHIDCATVYNNERQIGIALQRAVKEKQIQRQEFWITSKLWNNAHLPQHVRPAVERSIKDLGVKYLDLFLIHWPVSFRQDIVFPKKREQYLPPSEERLLATWQAMEKLVKKGLLRTIGVSNFKQSRLQLLLDNATIPPAVNQVECHPYLQQQELLAYCQKNNIILTAYSPLGSGDRPAKLRTATEPQDILKLPIIAQLAAEAGISPGQLILAWGLQRGICLIPKSTSKKHLQENLNAAKINLTSEIIQQIEKLNRHHRFIDATFLCGKESPYDLDWLWSN